MHPAAYHCLDVTAVAQALLGQRSDLLQALATSVGGDKIAARATSLALIAVHDIGKFSRPFQALSESAWPEDVLGPWRLVPYYPRHDAAAWLVLQRVQLPWFSAWRKRERDAMLAGVVGHHGRPVADPSRSVVEEDVVDEQCIEAASELVACAQRLFDVPPVDRPPRSAVSRSSWLLAGLTTVADWVGSNQRWFPYHPPSLAPDAYYYEVALPQAERAVVDAGLLPPRVARFPGFAELTGSAFPPTESQEWAATVALPAGPCLALIEDLTGSGKTEAALVLAHRLMDAGRADGIFVALPTMATANAMYGRLSVAYRRLYEADERPSLVLAHGAATLHDAFRQSVVPIDDPRAANTADDDRDGARAACAAWLADSRRKAFLADVGVGTIDQALLAVLPAKFQSLRLLGLARKVLIVDEAHAYDAYMSEELDRLLEFQAALGGSAIVLSATLPDVVRRKLIGAFERGAGSTVEDAAVEGYPRVALLGDGARTNREPAPRADLVRTLAISHAGDLITAKARVVDAARRGAAVAWIRNTVDDAIAAWRQLRDAGVDATLFHARFAMCDRLAIEDAVVARFGRAAGAERQGVVVATQVIEQSLDLDFDLIVSDLAPVDLLLQRAGRLWRHRRERRALDEPEFVVAGPPPASDAGADWLSGDWRGTGAVYRDHALLWLTAQELVRRRGRLEVPGDVRAVVEAVYGPTVEDRSFPPGLQRSATEAEGEAKAARAAAYANLLHVDAGYGGDHTGWDDDTHTPTRLGEETLTVRLGRVEDARILPWARQEDTRTAWALSEVRLRPTQLRAADVSSALGRAVEEVRASWSRFDDAVVLLPLECTNGQWTARGTGGQGRRVEVTYSVDLGLVIEEA